VDTVKEALRKPWVWLGAVGVALVVFIMRLRGMDDYSPVEVATVEPSSNEDSDPDMGSDMAQMLKDLMDKEQEGREDLFAYLGDLSRQVLQARADVLRMPQAMSETMEAQPTAATGGFPSFDVPLSVWTEGDYNAGWSKRSVTVDNPQEAMIAAYKAQYKTAEESGNQAMMDRASDLADAVRAEAKAKGITLSEWAREG
jgi:hypothetical protein